jgi:hypothetical protein
VALVQPLLVGHGMRRLAYLPVSLPLLVACSSPSQPAGSVDAASPNDSVTPADASIDALLGNACPTSATEVARIAGADIFPTTVGPAYYTSATQSFYTTDADGDGDRDLLLFEYVSSASGTYTYRTRLFRWTGSAFSAAVTSTITIPAYGVELNLLADVDGDKRKDLVLGYTTEYPRTPYVYLARQGSDGSFALQASRIDVSPCGSSQDQRLEAIAVFDFDRDGKDDVLATASFGGLGSQPAGLAVAKGSASGLGTATCIASSNVSMPGIPAQLGGAESFRVGDFDGDGAQDLVAESYTNGMSTMQLFRSTGASQLSPAPMTTTQSTSRLFVDHVAGRARDALVESVVHADNTELFRYTTDAQGIAAKVKIATLPVGSSSYNVLYGFAIGDFNGDALTDIAAIGNREYTTGPTPLALGCDRAGAWDTAQATLPEGTRILRTIDFDSDSGSEVVARVGSDVVVFDLH